MRNRLLLIIPLLFSVAGCASITNNNSQVILQQVVHYADLFTTSLASSVPAALTPLVASGQIKDVDAAKINAAVSALRQASVALDQANNLDQAQPLIQQVADAFDALIATAANVPQIPSQIKAYLLAVQAGLPVVEMIVELAANSQQTPPVPAPPTPPVPTPTPAPAALLLR